MAQLDSFKQFLQKDLLKESVPVNETKSLGKRIKVVKGQYSGEIGRIREIHHGLHKASPKSYYIDLDNGKQANNIPATDIRIVKESIPSVWNKKVINVVSQEDEEEKMVTCPECKGDGARYGDLCPTCDGHGEVAKSKVEDEEEVDMDGEDMDIESEDDLDPENQEDDDVTGEYDMEDEDDMDDEEPEDPDHMGVIRKVKDAHLVYKRADEEGTFEELWMYKAGEEMTDELDVRRDILAGTDIPQGKTKSEDNTQKFDLWTSGNVQFLHITGLPN